VLWHGAVCQHGVKMESICVEDLDPVGQRRSYSVDDDGGLASVFLQPRLRRASTAPALCFPRRGKVRKAIGKHRSNSEIERESAASEWNAHKHGCPQPPEAMAFVASQVRRNIDNLLYHEEDTELLLESMTFFCFKKDEALVRTGKACQYFFVVYTGKVELCTQKRDYRQTLERGDVWGGCSLLFDTPQEMSVIAIEDCCVCGVDGHAFRESLTSRALRRKDEIMSLLDATGLLDGLLPQHRARVSELPWVTEVHDQGCQVIVAGSPITAMKMVKTGRLVVREGRSGISYLEAGGSLFDGSVLHGSNQSKKTITVETRCELLCIDLEPLKAALGLDELAIFARRLLVGYLDRSPFLAQFSYTQKRNFAQKMDIKDYAPYESIKEWRSEFLLVIHGAICKKSQAPEPYLSTGQSRENFDGTLFGLPKHQSSRNERASITRGQRHISDLAELIAGPAGARIAALSQEELVIMLRECGIVFNCEETMEQARDYLTAKKIPIFHHLSDDQIDSICQSFILVRLSRGREVFRLGASATDWYIVAQGEVEEIFDGKKRILGKNGHFGIRALLFKEARTSTVRVVSDEALLWQLELETFDQIVTGSVRQNLMKRIVLRDTEVNMSDLRHERTIGSGSFGSVRLVEHKRSGLRYAVKRVRKGQSKAVMRLVAQECELLAEMDHPFILLLVRTFELPRARYILTELLTGGELLAALDEIDRPLNRSEAQFYAGSLVLVLDYLHDKGIVFRDLKPENVMLDAEGYLKLIDFGTAKKLDETRRTFTRIGSYHFMAPEIFRGDGYGTSVDLWSLGIMLYEFVCGYLPFGRDIEDSTGVEICRAVQTTNLTFPSTFLDREGKHVIRGLLSKGPERRLGSGPDGYRYLKDHAFFSVEGKETLFDQLLRRRLHPPFVPHDECFLSDAEGRDLSDASLFS